MTYLIYYGTIEKNREVTNLCIEKCALEKYKDLLFIPFDQSERDNYFTDIAPGHDKFIFIHLRNEIICFSNKQDVFFDLKEMKVYDQNNVVLDLVQKMENEIYFLNWLRSRLKINYGDFTEEFVEQRLVSKYIKGNEKILEIGGNIGRCALIISSILNFYNNTNFVCMECNTDIAKQLKHNRDINEVKFHIETKALSKRKIIQNGWHNVESDILLENHLPVENINVDELKHKYNINFDTLVVDCEEAFYVILQDMPEILEGIKLIIMENDYLEKFKKDFVDNVLKKRGFFVDYSEKGHWPEEYNRFPCYHNFYEVWKLN